MKKLKELLIIHVLYRNILCFFSMRQINMVLRAGSLSIAIFTVDRLLAWSTNPHLWRTGVSLFVWPIPFGLSGMDGPTGSVMLPPA
jgi:hypothetical protein